MSLLLITRSLAASSAFLAACASAPADRTERGASLAPEPPDPFALQYAGSYVPDALDPKRARGAPPVQIDLLPSGAFRLSWRGRLCEEGLWATGRNAHTLPLEVRLAGESGMALFTIGTYDGSARLVFGGAVLALHALCTVGPNESVCDASGGAWTDDDADAATGLYCLCAHDEAYVPSRGGCVSLENIDSRP